MKKFLLSLAVAACTAFGGWAETVSFVAGGTTEGTTTGIPTGEIVNKTTTTKSFTNSDITITFEKNNSSNTQVNGGLVRWYQSDYIEIAPLNNATITKVQLLEVGSSYTSVAVPVGIGKKSTDEKGTVLTTGTSRSWTGSATQSVYLYASKQVRFKTLEVTYTPGVAAAVATPEMAEPVAGTEGYTITLSCATEGAEIYYTTDGSTPTQSEEWPCAKYTGPFEIFEPCTLNAIAFKGEDKSAMLSKFLDLPVILSSLDGVAAFEPAEGQTIKFVCNTPQATVAYQNGNYLYLYAGNGFMAKAYQCFGYDTPTLTPGQAITKIEGSYGFRYGQPQITNFTITAGEVGTAPAPIEIDAISGYIETDMVGRWYTIKGVNITSVSGLDATMVLPADADLEREEETVALRNTFGLTSFEAGENLTVSGFVGIFNEGVQFVPTEILNEHGEKICALPVFNLEDGAYTENTEITISCETEGAKISYMINGGEVVEAPAPVTIILTEAMQIHATASAEGYSESDLVEANYTIKAEQPVIGTTATFDFAEAEFSKITCTPAVTYPTSGNSVVVSDTEMTVNGVSLVASKGSRNDAAIYNNGNNLRVYTGATMTISIGSAYTLSKITFTGDLACTTETGTLTGKVWTATETAARAAAKIQEVVFNCNGTNKITSIEVEFASAPTGIEAIEAEDAAPAVYYNLQGVRVENPANGLYIRVNGKKAEKVFIR